MGRALPVKFVTHNEYIRVIKEVFKLAIGDRVILKSLAAELKRCKVHDPVRLTPSWGQFKAIVAEIRAKVFNADCKESGDFIEFMGLAGLGQAELRNLTWSDIDLHALHVHQGYIFEQPSHSSDRATLL